jgi:hypothetical protein
MYPVNNNVEEENKENTVSVYKPINNNENIVIKPLKSGMFDFGNSYLNKLINGMRIFNNNKVNKNIPSLTNNE